IYTWVATSKPSGSNPLCSINANNASKNTSVTFDRTGRYSFTVTISDGINAISSAVDVTVNPAMAAISVFPARASLNLNANQQFSAAAYDQFGSLMPSQPAFGWDVTGGGVVDTTGLYAAPTIAGAAKIRASSGGIRSEAL